MQVNQYNRCLFDLFSDLLTVVEGVPGVGDGPLLLPHVQHAVRLKPQYMVDTFTYIVSSPARKALRSQPSALLHFTSLHFSSLHFTSLLHTTLITRSYLLRFLLFLITFIYLFGYLLANFVAFSCMPPILKIIENTLRSYIDFRSLLHYFPYTILSLPARLSFFNQSFYSS